MASYAQVTGRLGHTPELNYTHGGTPVVNLSVASNRQKKDADGNRVEVADWFKVSLFGRNAEILAEYGKKGSALAFNGRMLTDTYLDREGQQRTSVYLIADSFEFLPVAKRPGEGSQKEQELGEADSGEGDSDIPF